MSAPRRSALACAGGVLLAAAFARAAGISLTHAASVYADANGVALRAPEGIACTDNGYVVVADSGNHRLVQYRFGEAGFAGGTPIQFEQIGYPTRVQIGRAGNLLSLDQRTRRIVRVGAAGEFAGFVEMKNVPVGRGFFPVAFKLDGADSILVVDLASARLLILDPAGAFVRQFPLPDGAVIADVAADAAGTLFVLDTLAGAIWSAPRGAEAFTPFSKRLQEYLTRPGYLTVTARGQILVVDRNGNGLVAVGRDGSFQGRQLGMGWNDGLVYYPGQICADGKGTVFVADRNNHRVQAFTASK